MNTSGNDDSRLCNLATSHRSSLPFNFTISFMFLMLTDMVGKISFTVMKLHDTCWIKGILTVQDRRQTVLFQSLGRVR